MRGRKKKGKNEVARRGIEENVSDIGRGRKKENKVRK